jgi:hypothetical protein
MHCIFQQLALLNETALDRLLIWCEIKCNAKQPSATAYSCHMRREKNFDIVGWLTFLLLIHKALSSNLGPETGYTDRGFLQPH